jgi:hypothetical protein
MKMRGCAVVAVLLSASVQNVAAQGVLVSSFPPEATLGMIASDGVRLRSKPSTNASVLATEGTGALGVALGESDDTQNLGGSQLALGASEDVGRDRRLGFRPIHRHRCQHLADDERPPRPGEYAPALLDKPQKEESMFPAGERAGSGWAHRLRES